MLAPIRPRPIMPSCIALFLCSAQPERLQKSPRLLHAAAQPVHGCRDAATRRDIFEVFHVTPTEHHIVGEGSDQACHGSGDMLLSLLSAEPPVNDFPATAGAAWFRMNRSMPLAKPSSSYDVVT